jgi:nucleotide-binding universal stress UspA family protein
MTNTRTWLVAYDFSDHSKLALACACEQLGALGGGRLVLAYVHPPASDGAGIDIGSVGPGFGAHEETLMRKADKDLADVILGLPLLAGGEILYEHKVLTGRPADRLVDLATELDADQIVIGSHGRRGFERFLLGSVAERVLRRSDRTVLVVKH